VAAPSSSQVRVRTLRHRQHTAHIHAAHTHRKNYATLQFREQGTQTHRHTDTHTDKHTHSSRSRKDGSVHGLQHGSSAYTPNSSANRAFSPQQHPYTLASPSALLAFLAFRVIFLCRPSKSEYFWNIRVYINFPHVIPAVLLNQDLSGGNNLQVFSIPRSIWRKSPTKRGLFGGGDLALGKSLERPTKIGPSCGEDLAI